MTSDHSIEGLLRRSLRQDAQVLALPERQPERAVARSQVRRRNRRLRFAACAVLGAGILVAVPALRTSGPSGDDVQVGNSMLAPTGPLTLDWHRYDGGPSEAQATFQDDQGVIYALATAPGTAEPNDTTRALYRLGDDGTWQPVVLGEDVAPRAVDVSGRAGLLYAVSTGPGDGEDDPLAQLSTSADGGQSWTTEDLPSVPPPSDAIEWERHQNLAVESNGSATIALVTTTFSPVASEELFPELADDDWSYSVEVREEGLALIRQEVTTLDEGAVMVEPGSESETVRVVPWSDLGIESSAALAPPSEVFRSEGDGWQPLESDGGHYDGLTMAGGRFVLIGSPTSGTPTVVRTSEDGSSWSDAELPAPGRVVGLDNVLVDVPDELSGVIHVSGDGGRTWQPVDIAAAGIGAGQEINDVAGGPLGLALVTSTPDSARQLVVSGDLVDWTTTPLADVTGVSDPRTVSVFVGADRIVVRATPIGDDDESTPPPESVTAVATPERTP